MVEIEEKMSVMGYHGGNKVPFFRIVLSIPSHTPTARSTALCIVVTKCAFFHLCLLSIAILEEGLNVPGLGHISYRTFESNIPFVLRFMVDQNISGAPAERDSVSYGTLTPLLCLGGQWIKIPAGKYAMVSPSSASSTVQIEIECSYEVRFLNSGLLLTSLTTVL